MAKKVRDSLAYLPRKQTTRLRRRRVNHKLLSVPITWKSDLEDAEKAEAAVAQGVPTPTDTSWEWGPQTVTWTKLLDSIGRSHIGHIRQELGSFTTLSPVYPPESVQEAFFNSCSTLENSISVGYHGTKHANLPSIARRGLLKPGHGGVKVANGSAHGIGIYTATMGAASLSKGFCDSNQILICAICDTSCPMDASQDELFVPSQTHVMTKFPKRSMYGSYEKKRESKEVLHVGSAMVVFNERCVVPLFVASIATGDKRPCKWEPAQKVGKRRIAIPCDGDPGIIFPQNGRPRVGQTVWLPPKPLVDAKGWQKTVQRRIQQKYRHQILQFSREEKANRMFQDVTCENDLETGFGNW